MSEIREWSVTAAQNNETPPDGFPENMAYSAVNNAAREVMAAIARNYKNNTGELLTTGTSDALVLSPHGPYSTSSDGDRFSMQLHVDVNAAATLQVGTSSAVAIHDRSGEAIAASVLASGDIIDVVYRSSAWRAITATNGIVALQAVSVETGTILPFGSGTVPSGYLTCDGAAVSRTTYADLFAVIGTNFGVGDDSTTFNVPDLERRVAVGSGGTGTDDLGATVGSTGGSETFTEVLAHTHFMFADITKSSGSTAIAATNQAVARYSGAVIEKQAYTMQGATTEATVGLTSEEGTNDSGSLLQPSLVLRYMIKT